jgi:hypothetical protein
MKKKFYSTIVIVYSIICIYIMLSYKIPNKSINENISAVRKQQEIAKQDKNKEVQIQDKYNVKEYDNEADVASYNSSDVLEGTGSVGAKDYKKNKGIKIVEDNVKELYDAGNKDFLTDEVQGEFDSYNIEQRKRNQVIKVPVNDLISHLSLSEKGKLLAMSQKFKEDDYAKFQEFLGYKNQKFGIRKALEILEDNLSNKQVQEVKDIFSKYIDMDIVEEGK